MTRRLLTITTFTLAAAALGPAAAAQGAKPAPLPVVSEVSPLRLGIGDTMTITGKNFRKGANRNTVVFKRDGKKAIFVTAVTATTTRLTVVVPEKLRSSMSKQSGAFVATKFRLRVLTSRFAKVYTKTAASPVIEPLRALAAGPAGPAGPAAPGATAAGAPATTASTPAVTNAPAAPVAPTPPSDCDGDGIVDADDSDDDADLLPDTLEAALRTESCKADSDGDGMEDGWEYQSAIDLNRESCPSVAYATPCNPALPFPGKRPHVNPLYPDAGVDYDGDWLNAGHEHQAWKRKGVRSLTNLWYSDGMQASQDSTPGDSCRGLDASLYVPLLNAPEYSIDRNNSGCLNDAERDEDNDFLTNEEEVAGELSGPRFWTLGFEEPPFRIDYQGTDWLDSDTDGDTVKDGIDDQDHDDFWNVEELRRGAMSADKEGVPLSARSGLWVDPFNPCLPSRFSRTCPIAPPLQGGVWRPFTDRNATEPVKPRWPLYGSALYGSEVWNGKATAQQTMPPAHPLLPRP